MTITKEEFNKLYDDNISKKQYDIIIDMVETRADEIVKKMWKVADKDCAWWDFGNCNYEGENSNGYFDPKEYKEEIQIGGEWFDFPEPYYYGFEGHAAGFPTRWLWEENWETEFKAEVEKAKKQAIDEKQKAKQKREEAKAKKAALIASAKTKLTKEECRALGIRK